MNWYSGDGRRSNGDVGIVHYQAPTPLVNLEEVEVSPDLKDKALIIARLIVEEDENLGKAYNHAGLPIKSIALEKEIGKREARLFKKLVPQCIELLAVQKIFSLLEGWEALDYSVDWEIREEFEQRLKNVFVKPDSVHVSPLAGEILKKAHQSGWEKKEIYGLADLFRKKIGAAFTTLMIKDGQLQVNNSRCKEF